MQHPSFRPLTLAELRRRRHMRQDDVSAYLGVNKSSVSRIEQSTDPKLSSLDSFVEALGGRLVLLVVMQRADGSLEKHLVRTASDSRRDVTINILTAQRDRPPSHSRPAAAGYRARIVGGAE